MAHELTLVKIKADNKQIKEKEKKCILVGQTPLRCRMIDFKFEILQQRGMVPQRTFPITQSAKLSEAEALAHAK